MPQVGFEPTIPVPERSTTDHAFDCAATVIDTVLTVILNKWLMAYRFR
jgi:hypothetical protein